jgi:3-oxoacyl-[acyl-carrier protein] reductase
MSRFSVKDKTVLITGASRGIGKAFALAFKEEGAIVYGTGSSEKSISWMKDSGIEGKVNNVLEQDNIKEIIEEIKSKNGKLDVLVNNAGISKNIPASGLSEKDMEELISVNFKAVFRSSQAFYKTHKQNGGVIINIASVLGLRGFALSSIYSGTKGAVIQLTKACASEWTRNNFRLNAICPGFIDTDMVSNMKSKESMLAEINSKIPMKRMGKPEDLVGAALFLACDASSYITGQILVVDGGLIEIV